MASKIRPEKERRLCTIEQWDKSQPNFCNGLCVALYTCKKGSSSCYNLIILSVGRQSCINTLSIFIPKNRVVCEGDNNLDKFM